VRAGGKWSQQAELTASDAAAGDQFGYSVALAGSTLVVGATGKNSEAGAAYVFVRSRGKWSQQAELTVSDAAAGDRLGYSVGISGSTAVVSAAYKNHTTGAVYVFVRSGRKWSQQAELTAKPAAAGELFGDSVAVAGSTAVVSASVKNSDTGAVYVFVRSGRKWSQQAELTAKPAAVGEHFGGCVALAGSRLVVGAPYKNSDTGVVYVFEGSRGKWSQQAKLTASDTAGELFGATVLVADSTAVVGAPFKNSDAGAVYVFGRSSGKWSQQAELTAKPTAGHSH
jgi:hypothetical protein